MSLTVTGPGGSHTAAQTGFITVTEPEEVQLWIEAEDGLLQPPIEVNFDDTTSAGAYVWVPNGTTDLLDPLQDGGMAQYSFTVPEAGTYAIWGRVSPGEGGLGSFFLNVLPGANEEAGSVSELTPQDYQVMPLEVGDLYYTDRGYVIQAMPETLPGLLAIKTTNNHTLPGNCFGKPTGVGSNYIVLLGPGETVSVPTWSWQQANDWGIAEPLFFALDPGDYTLLLKEREAGTKIDRIFITNDLDFIPQGMGESEE